MKDNIRPSPSTSAHPADSAENNRRRFVLVTRKTRMQELIERFNTWQQAKFYLEHNQVNAADYLAEHDCYQRVLHEAESILRPLGSFQALERLLLPNYLFYPQDIVVVVGQDGLVANTLKYLDGQPVIAINPEPTRFDGKLLPFEINDLPAVLRKTLRQGGGMRRITFAEARTNDGQIMRAVNDLFIGPKSHTSARYQLKWGEHVEVQSSSGIIVSTGFGSTGWFQSLLAGAMRIMDSTAHDLSKGFAWDEQRLQFTVREPFPSKTTGTRWVFGDITADKTLRLESLTPENAVIFSDGIEADYLSFNSGSIVDISVSEKQGCLVVR